MTSNAITIITTTLAQCFRLFTSWHIPGTNFSPAQWFFSILVFVFAINYIRKLVGMADNVSAHERRHRNDK